MLLLDYLGVSDYAVYQATINIPVGAMTNDEYCTSIQLSSDGDIEQREETFTLSLAPLIGTFNPLNLASTVKTVTIIDGDSEFPTLLKPVMITIVSLLIIVAQSMLSSLHKGLV